MSAELHVVDPGLHTTIQDRGRTGHQSLGIPVSGALDWPSLEAANAIVGNPVGTACLECMYAGPTLEIAGGSVRVALTGTVAPMTLIGPDGTSSTRDVPSYQSVLLTPGMCIKIGPIRNSRVAYLGFEGGFDLQPVLGSFSTLVRAGIGGKDGRALSRGDMIPLVLNDADPRGEKCLRNLPPDRSDSIRVVLGPQDDHFTAKGLETFLNGQYTISAASDRMGMRLEGPEIEHDPVKGFSIVSDGIAAGAIQVPGNGLPIVLLADRQTTGGYSKIATVASADIPAFARLTPGSAVRFNAVDVETAETARRALNQDIRSLTEQLQDANAAQTGGEFHLSGQNLVSGVVDALDPA